MKKWFVKKWNGTFEEGSQPQGFSAITSIENRLFLCECPTKPDGVFVVEFPEEAQPPQWEYYTYENGKKLWYDPWNGSVPFEEEVDYKNRRRVMYTSEQLAIRINLIKWIAINCWIPDRARIYNISLEGMNQQISEVLEINDESAITAYVKENLYYDL